MKIKIINPNTTQAMTDGIREAALTVAGPDTEIAVVVWAFVRHEEFSDKPIATIEFE